MFAGRFSIVALPPVPDVETDPGVLINIQLPAGKSFKTTLPVENVQVGWVIVPMLGADGGLLTVRTPPVDVTLKAPPQLVI